MLNVVIETNVIFYLMIAIGVIGALAKVVSHTTLKRLIRASANMPKSTHKLMKLVRAKYEHACLAHDTVDNTEAFVEKFIYEYRALGLRLHTWRQMEKLSVWFLAILSVMGAAVHYYEYGIGDMVYRYAMTGIAEIVLLVTLFQLSDEKYKISAIQMYMIDYLENVYAHRYQKIKQFEKEKLNIISPETFSQTEEKVSPKEQLAINIEGEPKRTKQEEHGRKGIVNPQSQGETARQAVRDMVKETGKNSEKVAAAATKEEKSPVKPEETAEIDPQIREDAIRHILKEFLA